MDSVTRALMNDFAAESGLSDSDQSKQFEHFAAFSVVSARHTDGFETDDLVVGDGGVLPSCWWRIVQHWQRLDHAAISAV